jgi:fatty-acyl-CoA synthase
MRQDAQGYFYFVDRVGDTFRWKGENVATSEVAAVLSDIPGVLEVSVYGVAVPGQEGRAGMAALVTEPDFAPETIGQHINGRLPAYARPLFLRLSPTLEVTATFKHRKQTLVREGFDPSVIGEPIFWFNTDAQSYERLGAAHYTAIIEGDVRL